MLRKCIAEVLGTFVLIFLGDGAVAVSVLTGSYDLMSVSVMWGIAVMLAVYLVGAISGAHLNPAVTIASAVLKKHPWREVIPYILSQILGAFLAAGLLYIIWAKPILAFEMANNIVRTSTDTLANSGARSAMIFYTFAPNPAIGSANGWTWDTVSPLIWFISELVITSTLVWWILMVTDTTNPNAPSQWFAPVIIGAIVAALVAYESPISMAALNPARDLGPRILCWLAGWGKVAFPGPRGLWWIPSVSTVCGGLVGALIYSKLNLKLFEGGER